MAKTRTPLIDLRAAYPPVKDDLYLARVADGKIIGTPEYETRLRREREAERSRMRMEEGERDRRQSETRAKQRQRLDASIREREIADRVERLKRGEPIIDPKPEPEPRREIIVDPETLMSLAHDAARGRRFGGASVPYGGGTMAFNASMSYDLRDYYR